MIITTEVFKLFSVVSLTPTKKKLREKKFSYISRAVSDSEMK